VSAQSVTEAPTWLNLGAALGDDLRAEITALTEEVSSHRARLSDLVARSVTVVRRFQAVVDATEAQVPAEVLKDHYEVSDVIHALLAKDSGYAVLFDEYMAISELTKNWDFLGSPAETEEEGE